MQPSLSGVRSDRREVVTTTAIDAEPQGLAVLARPSLAPFMLALASSVIFIGTLWSFWWVPIGLLLAILVLSWWNWPRDDERTPHWKSGGAS